MAKETNIKKGELIFKYFSTLRPVSIGTYPEPKDNQVIEIYNFGKRIDFDFIGVKAWGWIRYKRPLSPELAKQYDLIEVRMMI